MSASKILFDTVGSLNWNPLSLQCTKSAWNKYSSLQSNVKGIFKAKYFAQKILTFPFNFVFDIYFYNPYRLIIKNFKIAFLPRSQIKNIFLKKCVNYIQEHFINKIFKRNKSEISPSLQKIFAISIILPTIFYILMLYGATYLISKPIIATIPFNQIISQLVLIIISFF